MALLFSPHIEPDRLSPATSAAPTQASGVTPATPTAVEEPETRVDHHREERDEDHEPEHGSSVDGAR